MFMYDFKTIFMYSALRWHPSRYDQVHYSLEQVIKGQYKKVQHPGMVHVHKARLQSRDKRSPYNVFPNQ